MSGPGVAPKLAWRMTDGTVNALQVVNLHYMLSKTLVKARPSVLWCYKKDLYLSRCVVGGEGLSCAGGRAMWGALLASVSVYSR